MNENSMRILNSFGSNIPSLMSIDDLLQYIASTGPILTIGVINGLSLSLLSLLVSIVHTFLSLLVSLYYLLAVILKVVFLGLPHIFKIMFIIIEFHRTQLGFYDLFIEAVIVFFFVLYLLFRPRIISSWRFTIHLSSSSSSSSSLLLSILRTLEQSIGTRYKKSVKLLPHVLFFTISLFISIFGRRLLTPLTNTYVLPFITIIIPWINTIRMICFSSIDMTCPNYKNVISLWIVLTCYHSLATLLSLIPFSYYVVNMLPFLREIVVVVICWSQILPYCNDLVYESANPILLNIKSKMIGLGLENGHNYNQHNDIFSRFLTGIRYMNLIGERQEDFIRALMQDSIAFLLTLLFSFSPSPLANFGIIVISMLLPLFKSAGTLTGRFSGSLDSKLCNPNGSQRKEKKTIKSPLATYISPKTDLTSLRPAEKALLLERKRWLEYWICYYFLFLLKLYGYNMWPSIFMWICLWLQHNYFLGASVLLKGIYDTIAISIVRNSKYQAEKRRAFIDNNPNPNAYVIDTPNKENYEKDKNNNVDDDNKKNE